VSVLRAVAVVTGLGFGSGCGGPGSDYERDASALCHSFNEAAFAGHVEIDHARTLYGRLGDGFARLSPPDALRHTHDVLIEFARDGEGTFVSISDPDPPTVDLRLTVGDWEADVPRVQRELPQCADTLTGTDRDREVELIG
jgi:hypothetical protein